MKFLNLALTPAPRAEKAYPGVNGADKLKPNTAVPCFYAHIGSEKNR
jgi:hypothetical protein